MCEGGEKGHQGLVFRHFCYIVLSGVDLSCIVLQTSIFHGQPADRKPLGHYREALNHYKQTGVILNYDFDDKELYDDMQICYSSQVVVVLPNCPYHIVGSSYAATPQKQLAREEAARSAVQQLKSLPIPLLPQRGKYSKNGNHWCNLLCLFCRQSMYSFETKPVALWICKYAWFMQQLITLSLFTSSLSVFMTIAEPPWVFYERFVIL